MALKMILFARRPMSSPFTTPGFPLIPPPLLTPTTPESQLSGGKQCESAALPLYPGATRGVIRCMVTTPSPRGRICTPYTSTGRTLTLRRIGSPCSEGMAKNLGALLAVRIQSIRKSPCRK
jgi:hypothetical protein